MQRSSTLCHDRVGTDFVTSWSMVLYPHMVLIMSVWKENKIYELHQETAKKSQKYYFYSVLTQLL